MSTAILTIDDIASKNTPAIVDYLYQKKIQAVMFAVGMNVEKYYDEAIYAVQKGMIVGNHSYSHVSFSNASISQCMEEIEKTEEILDKLYQDAGVERCYRPFRFPYGDKGNGKNGSRNHYEAIQDYLRKNHFSKLKDSQIEFSWWYEKRFDKDIDTYWTFDFMEYRIPRMDGFTLQSVYERILDNNPKQGGALLKKESNHIVLLHAHDETESIIPAYYGVLLDYCINKGVQFVAPKFIDET